MILRSGVKVEEQVVPTLKGASQGSPLSPLLSNIMLNELDKELERRNLSFCRYADDCNIFVRSERAAKRVLESITRFIETRLKLRVNLDKTKTAICSDVVFLGMTLMPDGRTFVSRKAFKDAKAQVKEMTPRSCNLPVEQQLAEISKWYRGWINYFNMASSNRPFEYLEGYIRRRVRSRLIGDLKRRKYLARKLHKLGGGNRRTVNHVVYSNKRRWALSRTRVVHRAWSNAWFAANGFAPSNLR